MTCNVGIFLIGKLTCNILGGMVLGSQLLSRCRVVCNEKSRFILCAVVGVLCAEIAVLVGATFRQRVPGYRARDDHSN